MNVEISKVSGYEGETSIGWVVRPLDAKTVAVVAALPPEHVRRGSIVLPSNASAMSAATIAANVITSAEGGPNAVAPLVAMAWGKA